MPQFKCMNGPMVTTAAQAKVTTGTAIKTMLQIGTPSSRAPTIIAWGFSLDVAPGAASVVELLQTDVAATVTAHTASGIQPLDPNGTASLCVGGVNLTGYTATVEGTPTATRMFDVVEIPLAAGAKDLTYSYQFMPDERPVVGISKFLRVRATFATSASNMVTWVVWDE